MFNQHRNILLLALIALMSPVVYAQSGIPARKGNNFLIVEVYNRTGTPYSNIQARFTLDRPQWLFQNENAVGKLSGYQGEKSLGKSKLILQVPFQVAQSGYTDAKVNVELLDGQQVLGTFPVVLDFADVQSNLSFLGKREGEQDGILQLADESSAIPEQFALKQNFPNPFNPTTIIQFDLPQSETVILKIYDLLGQELRTLVDRELPAGSHQARWDGKNNTNNDVPTGTYIYRIVAGKFVSAKKMVLVH